MGTMVVIQYLENENNDSIIIGDTAFPLCCWLMTAYYVEDMPSRKTLYNFLIHKFDNKFLKDEEIHIIEFLKIIKNNAN